MNVSRLLAISLTTFVLAACGGGGGGGGLTPSNPDAVFTTFGATAANEGDSVSFNLTGTAKGPGVSEALTGSITFSRKPNEIIGTDEFIVVDIVFVIRIISQGTTISSSNTSYIELDGTLVRIEQDDGVICFPNANYESLPTTVKYGDAGNLGSTSCSDGTSISGSYLVEVSDRNRAWAAVRNFSTYSEPGFADLFQDIVYHITENGELKAIDIFAGDGELSFELSS